MAKSRTMRASVVYVPKCQTRANFSFLHANVPINVLKVRQFFKFVCQNFQFFSEEFFNFLNFSILLSISKFQEYLAILENKKLIVAKQII